MALCAEVTEEGVELDKARDKFMVNHDKAYDETFEQAVVSYNNLVSIEGYSRSMTLDR